MFKKLGLLVLVLNFMVAAGAQAENMSDVSKSKVTMEKVATYIKTLRAKRATQTASEIMDEKLQTIESNIFEVSQAGDFSINEIESLRFNAIAQLNKFEGIDDAAIIVEMEIAEIERVMTSENLMFMFTRINLEWYDAAISGQCVGPMGTRQGCMLLTVLCTPLAIVGDIVLFPFAFVGSAATGF